MQNSFSRLLNEPFPTRLFDDIRVWLSIISTLGTGKSHGTQRGLFLSWKDQFFISPLGQWMDEHRNILWNAGTVVLAVVIWSVIQISRSHDIDSARHVNDAYTAWKTKPDDEQLYRTLQKALDKTPSMRAALQSEIAQQLLCAGDCDEAEKWAKTPIKELQSIAPLYAEFSQISFLIKREHYQEALERSVSLKEKIASHGSVLASRNLLRIALIQQPIGNRAGEMAAWNDWEKWIETENNKTLRERSLKGLWDQTISFQSYINERKASIVSTQFLIVLSAFRVAF